MTPTVLFEDDWILAVDKPSGMAVHPGAGVHDGTVNDWVRQHLGPRAVRNGFPASIAHRLDRETSGVLLIAVRRPAMRALSLAFEQHHVSKEYLALVAGTMQAPSGRIDRSLADESHRVQSAVTNWEVVETFSDATLLRIRPETGRKHQIRRHLADVSHPIAGDGLHGDADFNAKARRNWSLPRLFLHAASIAFEHPHDGRPMRLNAPLPVELEKTIACVRRAETRE